MTNLVPFNSKTTTSPDNTTLGSGTHKLPIDRWSIRCPPEGTLMSATTPCEIPGTIGGGRPSTRHPETVPSVFLPTLLFYCAPQCLSTHSGTPVYTNPDPIVLCIHWCAQSMILSPRPSISSRGPQLPLLLLFSSWLSSAVVLLPLLLLLLLLLPFVSASSPPHVCLPGRLLPRPRPFLPPAVTPPALSPALALCKQIVPSTPLPS